MKKAILTTALALAFAGAAGGLSYAVTNNYNQANIKDLNVQIEQSQLAQKEQEKENTSLKTANKTLTDKNNELTNENKNLLEKSNEQAEKCNELENVLADFAANNNLMILETNVVDDMDDNSPIIITKTALYTQEAVNKLLNYASEDVMFATDQDGKYESKVLNITFQPSGASEAAHFNFQAGTKQSIYLHLEDFVNCEFDSINYEGELNYITIDTTQTVERVVQTPEKPTIEGYEFMGWSLTPCYSKEHAERLNYEFLDDEAIMNTIIDMDNFNLKGYRAYSSVSFYAVFKNLETGEVLRCCK